jgi:hypothetical protein
LELPPKRSNLPPFRIFIFPKPINFRYRTSLLFHIREHTNVETDLKGFSENVSAIFPVLAETLRCVYEGIN